MEYQAVFQTINEEFSLFLFIPIVLITVGFGIVWYAIRYIKNNLQNKLLAIVFGVIFGLFALYGLMNSLPERYVKQNKFMDYFLYKEPQIAEGKIENYKKYEFRGDEWCSFTVNEIVFRYQEDRIDRFFNNTSGLIEGNGQDVRLSYLEYRLHNPIVKVEIK